MMEYKIIRATAIDPVEAAEKLEVMVNSRLEMGWTLLSAPQSVSTIFKERSNTICFYQAMIKEE